MKRRKLKAFALGLGLSSSPALMWRSSALPQDHIVLVVKWVNENRSTSVNLRCSDTAGDPL